MTTTADQSPTIARDAALLARWRAGERRALDRLLMHYEPWVQQRVNKAARTASADLRDDVAQEARVALLRSAQHWDPASGVTLMGYAAPAVERACWLAVTVNTADPMVPESVIRNRLPAVSRAARSIRAERPDITEGELVAEVSARLDLRCSLVERLLVIGARAPNVALDEPVTNDGEEAPTRADFLADPLAAEPDDDIYRAQQRRLLRAAIASLPNERDRRLMEARLYRRPHSPPSLRELAPEFGITFQRLGQIEARAIAQVRQAVRGLGGL